jgi:hypothetical protein
MTASVAGLRPCRAPLAFTLNLPKLGRLTSSPFFAASTIPENTASAAFLAVLCAAPHSNSRVIRNQRFSAAQNAALRK